MNGASAADVTDGGKAAAAYWRARCERYEQAYRHVRLAVLSALEPDETL